MTVLVGTSVDRGRSQLGLSLWCYTRTWEVMLYCSAGGLEQASLTIDWMRSNGVLSTKTGGGVNDAVPLQVDIDGTQQRTHN